MTADPKRHSQSRRRRSQSKAGGVIDDLDGSLSKPLRQLIEAGVKARDRIDRARTRSRSMPHDKRAVAHRNLLKSIRAARLPLNELYDLYSGREYEDLVYRFYHQSFKVYWFQRSTTLIVAALQALAPDRPLNTWFQQLVKEGTGKTF